MISFCLVPQVTTEYTTLTTLERTGGPGLHIQAAAPAINLPFLLALHRRCVWLPPS